MSIFSFVGEIIAFFKTVWEFIKKIFVPVLNFVKNIVSFFKQPDRLEKLKQDEKKLAIAIKENLDNGNYNVINCIFDEETNEVVDYSVDSEVVNTESLDSETSNNFGDKDMIVLK